MIIGIDAHNVRGNGGSLVHLKELLKNTSPDKNNFERLVIWVNSEIYTKLPRKPFIEYIILPDRNYISAFIWQKFKLGKEAKNKKCNVLFFPGGIYLGSFKPFIAFSQGMLPFDYEARNIYRTTLQYWILVIKEYLMRHSLIKADTVIFVSNAIKKQVEKVSKQRLIKSNVIHHGVSEIFKNNIERPSIKELQRKKLPIKLLTVSSHAKHKNLLVLVKAISEIKNEGFDIELKVIGSEAKYGTKELLKEVKTNDPASKYIKILEDVRYQELPKYYNWADIFIAPSQCESFGLPILEAIVNKKYVVYNSIDTFEELIKTYNYKQYSFNFNSTKESLKKTLLKLLNSDIDIKGNIELNNFRSWEDCTKETFKYLNDVVSDNN